MIMKWSNVHLTPHHVSHVRCQTSHVRCHMSVSGVTSRVSHVRCHMSGVKCRISFYKGVELVGGESDINGAYPV